MSTVRLTMAQALVRYLCNQRTVVDGTEVSLFAGCFAIFGHGNVSGLGEALYAARDQLPTHRPHNEQGMAHAALAYAKQMRRRRMMVCTTSIGPGALNLVTAAGVGHVNRLPVLLLPGETFAHRRPDPVLQQVEDFADPTVTANDCLRPVSRFFDRIMRPEQLVQSLPMACEVLLDPARTGPVTLCLPQDVQAEAYDYPADFFAPRVRHIRRPGLDARELDEAVAVLQAAKRPLIIAGGGVHYAGAHAALDELARSTGMPVAETQAGKGALLDEHPQAVGAVGVTGTAAANALAEEADVVLAVGTRLQDFTTGSWALFASSSQVRFIGLNVAGFDASKRDALPVVGDADIGLRALAAALDGHRVDAAWGQKAAEHKKAWAATCAAVTAMPAQGPFSDAHVIGAVWRQTTAQDTVLCAAGGLPGELHKLWQSRGPDDYHLEYGFSCMGYEIAGGLGARLAKKDGEVIVFVGDGSYLMLNSEIVTAQQMGQRLTLVLVDNRGYGCINRLQQSCGSASFNNLLDTLETPAPQVDFAAHARALGAHATVCKDIAELEAALQDARTRPGVKVCLIETDARLSTSEGGAWWDVPVPEVSTRADVTAARRAYDTAKARQW